MDDQKALSIVSALANGVNPLSGEVFPVDSPYQASDVVRALFAAARALERVMDRRRRPRRRRRMRPLRENERAPDCRATSASRGVPRRISACLRNSSRAASRRSSPRLLGRTLAGIEARLEKHGRLTPQQRQTVNRYPKAGSDGNASSRPG